MYNNTPSNVIVNAVSNISYRPMLQAVVFEVLFMNELKNLTTVVNTFTNKTVFTTFFYSINFKIIIVQVRYITIETKDALDIMGFCFWFLCHFFCFNSTVSYTQDVRFLTISSSNCQNDTISTLCVIGVKCCFTVKDNASSRKTDTKCNM